MSFPISIPAFCSQTTADLTERTVTTLSLAGKDVVGAAASQAAQSSYLPLEVMLVILGSLLVSGFMLLLRESRIEKRNTSRGR